MVVDLNQPALPCPRGVVVDDGGERAGRSDVGCENLYHIDINCSPLDADGNSSGRASVQSSDVDNKNVFEANFPIQLEDFYLISVGIIDSRPTYHDRNQIWPVGYKSMWHDKITGSLFEFDIMDGGDSGPDFMLRRYPCKMKTIPVGSSVISRKKMASRIGACDEDDKMSLQTMLTENRAPCLNDEIHPNDDRLVNLVESDLDSIGDFGVQGRSLSSIWENCCRTLFDALYEAYNKTHAIQVGCEHDHGNYVERQLDILSKFSSSTVPIGILHASNSDNEFRSACENVKKWLQADRFGLDADFVQKIIEQLPGATGCSQYTPLIKRNGVKRMRDNSESDCYVGTSKRARENSSDALRAWDFHCCYSEVLELQERFSFQELEAELNNPCDSRILKFHIAMLKVLVNELPSKVATTPNFDVGVMMLVNEATWYKVTRIYILAMSRGTLCESLTGVTSMEDEALLLSDSTRTMFGPLADKNATADGNSCAIGEAPEWAQVLEPVRKLPANVGSRLRKCIYKALEKNPPRWAKEKLEHSISKGVYKGNASGPTKRAVISVLDRVNQEKSHENPKQEKKEKQKRVNTVADLAGYSSRCPEMVVQLANNMESKEYRELTADEKILLLKFLCDEVQNSSFLRDHVDHHASFGD